MPVAIPNTEPALIVAGDSVSWTKTIPLYLASDGWTLTYSFQKLGSTSAPITIEADPSGADYLVELDATDTDNWPAGNYVLTGYVDDGSTARHTVLSGSIQIVPNPAAALGSTHASRTLALIDLAIEGRIPQGMQQYSIAGQQVTKISIKDLVSLRSIYAEWVRTENTQDRLNRGLTNTRNVYARFTSPR